MKENHDKTQNMITKELETNMYNYKELTQQFEEQEIIVEELNQKNRLLMQN